MGECRKIDELEEVPNINALKKRVESYKVGWDASSPGKFGETWNEKFHKLLAGCDIKIYYPTSKLPECYQLGNSCGHILHVDLEETTRNTLHLTMLESVTNNSPCHSLEVASSFVNTMTFQNPVWDLGFQFAIAKKFGEIVQPKK